MIDFKCFISSLEGEWSSSEALAGVVLIDLDCLGDMASGTEVFITVHVSSITAGFDCRSTGGIDASILDFISQTGGETLCPQPHFLG